MMTKEEMANELNHRFLKALGNWETEVVLSLEEAKQIIELLEEKKDD